MNLPDLAWQVIYGRLAWAVVVAAALVALWSLRRPPSPPAIAGVLLGSVSLMALPGMASPAHWLGLAFQWPSALCVALCGLSLRTRWQRQGGTVMNPAFSAVGALAGAALYLDATGWLSWGLYADGFGPGGAPIAAVAMSVACVAAVALGTFRLQAGAVLAALTLFMVLRLPTGNLWDTLLDPFLWIWAVGSLLASWRHTRQRSPVQVPASLAAES